MSAGRRTSAGCGGAAAGLACFAYARSRAGSGRAGPCCGVDEAGRGPRRAGGGRRGVFPSSSAARPRRPDRRRQAPVRRRAGAGPPLPCARRRAPGFLPTASVPLRRLKSGGSISCVPPISPCAARRRAASPAPALVLVDGNRAPPLPWPVRCIIGGDARSLSIAAASILAKTVRDRAMARLDRRWPAYGFARHAGYPTPAHRAALAPRSLAAPSPRLRPGGGRPAPPHPRLTAGFRGLKVPAQGDGGGGVGKGLDLPLDEVLVEDCVAALKRLPPASVHAIFADPPYNLQLKRRTAPPRRQPGGRGGRESGTVSPISPPMTPSPASGFGRMPPRAAAATAPSG